MKSNSPPLPSERFRIKTKSRVIPAVSDHFTRRFSLWKKRVNRKRKVQGTSNKPVGLVKQSRTRNRRILMKAFPFSDFSPSK